MTQTEPIIVRSQTGMQRAMTRTRCPGCKKLFAVETETLTAMSRAGVVRAEFTCTGDLCHEAFAIHLPLPQGQAKFAVIPAIEIERVYQAPATEPVLNKMPVFIEEAEQKQAVPKASVAERDCPRCGATNVATSSDCARCGIVFERMHDERIDEEIALGGSRELSGFWDKILEDYEDRIRHDKFVHVCRDAGALSYASKKYSQILIAAPQDDIARSMRNRIVAMISVRAESSRLPIRLGFRIPKLNSMALFGGSILFFWGLAMPQLKNIMEIGLSLMLLSIGVRVALRSRI
jgi:hypothetical protein